ncbi:DUF1294 domain-containing protein [Nocardioides sp. GY 10113]|uniref:DUF1294 domain-containing protein n=1 Tax=Nocardioides sp. GY 10113 TaxID=2569761 RepID=UPI0010A8926B|nr:DUF1294 domain-containing protein [Nocardioides sp. GY 10113]TIC87523.1 DUF1294 domain-containing protein [Nocardioides sp. GY 10113]
MSRRPGDPRAADRRSGRSPAARRATRRASAVAAAFYGVLGVLVLLDEVPAVLLAAYGVLSVVAFVVYRSDKSAAEHGRWRWWRTPESTLHALALVGGWPGALVARQALRHKTVKQPFRSLFWVTVVANCAALAAFVALLG